VLVRGNKRNQDAMKSFGLLSSLMSLLIHSSDHIVIANSRTSMLIVLQRKWAAHCTFFLHAQNLEMQQESARNIGLQVRHSALCLDLISCRADLLLWLEKVDGKGFGTTTRRKNASLYCGLKLMSMLSTRFLPDRGSCDVA